MTTIPTLQQLYSNVLADLESEFNVTIPVIGKSFLRGLAAVQAAKLWLSYKALGNVQKNTFADTADSESLGGTLERWGRVKLGRNPFPATSGQYTIQVSGTIGAVIPAQRTFKSDDSSLNPNKLYTLDADFILDGINLIVVRALESGIDSKLSIADTMSLTAPISLVDQVATVTEETIQPQAPEDLEEYREKILESFRLEAQGGAGADYRLWSGEVQGVNQSYPYAVSGFYGEVNLYIEATLADSSDGFGTPTQLLLDAVEENIEVPTVDLPARKPLGTKVNYLAVTPLEITINISSFVGSTPTTESTIENAIIAALELIRPFVDSIDVLSEKNDIFDVNNIISIILAAQPGSVFGAVTLTVDGNVVSTFTFLNGNIPYLGLITYV